MKAPTIFGIDKFLIEANQYREKRIGLVCNEASRTTAGIHSRVALAQAGFSISVLFTPEHGLDSQGVDGAYMQHGIDPQTNIRIVSLYSEQLAPTQQDLQDIDIILIDLPDIGARFYTYLWTMSYILESAERYNKPVILLDRPNPHAQKLSLAEGPLLDQNCQSFIGRFSIPVTHHCTFGELARYFKAMYYPKVPLQIIPLSNWDRMINEGYPFFPTSPAIQKRETIYTYPGACLFEGLNIHEGRETAHPFAQFGAPWIDASQLLKTVQERLKDASVQEVHFQSTTPLYPQEYCHGLYVKPLLTRNFQSVRYFIEIIKIIDELFPEKLQEREYHTNVNPTGHKHLNLLLGVPHALDAIRNNTIHTELSADQWINSMTPYLLY